MTAICIMISICISMVFYNACGIILECINRSKNKDPEISATQIAEITREFRINQCTRLEQQLSEQSMRNKQSIYKVDGDFNGDIKGDNVTVILMGDGDVNGNIESNDGNVVLIKGNVNGNIKANKVVYPTNPTTDNKVQHICKSCYHYVQTPTGSYCTESSALGDALPVGSNVCKSYDGTGETTKYKSDCARFSNRSGICHFFYVNTCDIKHDCPYKIKRDECKTVNSTAKHNPATDAKSPKYKAETLWSCDIPPKERMDYAHDGKHLTTYNTFPVVNIKCPYCKKNSATQFKVQTTILDEDILTTTIGEIEHVY